MHCARVGISVVGLVMMLVSAGAAIAACSSFSSSDPPPSDAGTDTTEDVAASDASVGDACARYCDCQVGAAFCADFDTAALLGEWNITSSSDGSVLAVAPSDRSPPNALDVSTPASDAGAGASVKTRIAGNMGNLSLSFDVASSMLAQPTAAGVSAELVQLSALDGDSGGAGIIALVRTPSGMKLLIPGGTTESTDLPSLPNTRPWVRVHVDVKAGFVTVRYDDGPASTPAAPLPATTSTNFAFRLGLSISGASEASRLTYDNVVLRLE